MVDDPGPERTPLGMRLIWLLVPALLFGLYFWKLLGQGSSNGPEEPTEPAVETEVVPER